ncbi:ABC transporter permease subunit [Terrihabitans sp. B22-R8]|uniref:ABC transporter permease subunit n=1 Tax=Terrihabitans sp. B22-R8 TaxID=3425128 RepID=UPI00403C4CF6
MSKSRVLTMPAILGLAGLALVLWGAFDNSGRWAAVAGRLPQLLTGSVEGWPIRGGFAANIFISIVGMAAATALGGALGILSMARLAPLRLTALFIVNFLRNSPWLVLLFATLYLLPFSISLFGWTVPLPPLVKAIFGLSLPVAANLAEVVRGAVQSIHSGQWESARSLGYTRLQTYRYVILPQAYRRMLPGWMNLYALLMVATSLATVTGVEEVVTVLKNILAVESESIIVHYYLITLLMFFFFCYPIATAARKLESSTRGDSL